MKELKMFIKYLRDEKRYSEHTMYNYTNDIMQFLKFIQKPPSKIIKNDITNFTSYLRSLDSKITTSNRKLSSLKSFFLSF